MYRALALATLLAGCSQIFGLDEGQVADAPVPHDAVEDPALVVTGDYMHRYARNRSGAAAPVLETVPFGPQQPTVTVMLDDGTEVPTTGGAGTFSFERATPDQGYLVTLDDGDIITRYQHTASTLHAIRRTAGRPVASTSRAATGLTWNPSSGGTVGFIATTGQWSHTNAPFIPSPPNTTRRLLWNAAAPTGGTPLGELVESEGDVVWALETKPNGPYAAVMAINRTVVTTRGEAALPVNAPLMQQVPATRCTEIHSANKTALLRSENLIVHLPTRIIADYRVSAVPFADALGHLGEIWMALASTESAASAEDSELSVEYPPAIPDHDYLVSATLQYQHNIALGTMEAPVASQLRRFDRAIECGQGTPVLARTVGLPTAFQIAGSSLANTGFIPSIALPASGRIEIEWTVLDGDADYTSIQIYELTLSGAATVSRVVETVFAVTSPVQIPTTSFMPGRTYIIAFTTFRGYPGAATGDFSRLEFPNDLARIWSSKFEIAD